MKKSALMTVVIMIVLACLQTSSAGQKGGAEAQPLALPRVQAPRVIQDFGKMPLCFIPNDGQVNGPAAFYVKGRDKTIYFSPEGLTFVLNGTLRPAPERWVVKLDFVDRNPEAIPVSLEESGTIVSYFRGKPADWRSGLAASSKIIYRDLWPGIDLLYYGTMDRLKHEFLVRPGADPSKIRLAYRGAETVTLTDAGQLEVETPAGVFKDDIPAAWQESRGIRTSVPARYVLEAGQAGADGRARVYGFDIGSYDERSPLVLDPAVIVYCGYLGGIDHDEGVAIALDGAGDRRAGSDISIRRI
jgi:hypothetical protein